MSTATAKRIPVEAVLTPLLVLGALWVALAPGSVPRIACVFRMLTDLPCLACGSTRAVLALGDFDLAGAFAMNPLTTLIAFGAILYVVRTPLVLAGVLAPLTLPKARVLLYVFGAVAAINWVYLIASGR